MTEKFSGIEEKNGVLGIQGIVKFIFKIRYIVLGINLYT